MEGKRERKRGEGEGEGNAGQEETRSICVEGRVRDGGKTANGLVERRVHFKKLFDSVRYLIKLVC